MSPRMWSPGFWMRSAELMPLGRIQLDRVLLYGAGRALDRGERARRAWLTMPRKSARSLPVPEAVPGPAG